MGEHALTAEQRAALAWLYAAAEQAPLSRRFTHRRYGRDTWARPAGAVSGPEYRLPGDMLDQLVAQGLSETVAEGEFALRAGWPEWEVVRGLFPPPAAQADVALAAD